MLEFVGTPDALPKNPWLRHLVLAVPAQFHTMPLETLVPGVMLVMVLLARSCQDAMIPRSACRRPFP